ncbi:MAG: hypothetical protein GX922_05215 [Firmicutes bacterium]|jgi:hypothetical protein|nr:hypothetical protein [Bacillota bacterium]
MRCGKFKHDMKKDDKTKCECCKEFSRFLKRDEAVRVWVRKVVDNVPANQPPFGLDGSGVFRIAKIGCNCIVLILLNPSENFTPWREYVVKCEDIVAMRGGPIQTNT